MTASNQGLIFDMPSDEYHGEKGSFSSSQLKTMLEDPELFYRKYITKEVAKEESAAFDTGTYFHCAILEPHRLEEECIVFSGAIRRGKEWDAFKEKHSKKAILTKNELEKAETLIAAVKNSPVAMRYLEGAAVEVSAMLIIYVMGRHVYTVIGGEVQKLTLYGWEFSDLDLETLEDFAVKLKMKVRADSIRIGEGVISDLKSTNGNCKDEHAVMGKVAEYQYDLSAALYLDIFTAVTGDVYEKFAWIFASKDIGNSKTWIASERQIRVGRKKWKKAVVLLAHYISNDWTFQDQEGILEPTFWNAALLHEEEF